MRKMIILVIGVALSLPALATAQRKMASECRSGIVNLCGVSRDRGAIRECLTKKATLLSSTCQDELRESVSRRMSEQGGKTDRSNVTGIKANTSVEYAYGTEALQKLDFYPVVSKTKAPLILFVHGGGWKRGDKNNATGQFKAPHYNGIGYAFASINYRLVPEASVEQQARDVVAALAWTRANADKLNIDPSRIILMGHSAGAHLVALVGTDPQYLRASGLKSDDIRGIIALDGAAYDVPAQMTDGARIMKDTYAQAFGSDVARQRALSPTLHANAPNTPSFLILHVDRDDGKRQSNALAKALLDGGTSVQLNAVAGKGLKGHMEINRLLGKTDYPATPIIDKWLAERFK